MSNLTAQVTKLNKEEISEFGKFIRKLNRNRKVKGQPRIGYYYKAE